MQFNNRIPQHKIANMLGISAFLLHYIIKIFNQSIEIFVHK